MLNEEKVLGVKINTGLNYQKTIEHIENTLLKDEKCHYICTTNPEFIMSAQSNPEFRSIINNSDLSVPDGSGILFAIEYNKRISKLAEVYKKKSLSFIVRAFLTGMRVGFTGLTYGNSFGECIFGVSLAEKICELSSKRGYSVFFLGGWPKDLFGNKLGSVTDLATTAAEVMRNKYPNMNIVGSTSRYRSSDIDDAATITYIKNAMIKANISRLDLLLVAYDHIDQEKWILRNTKNIPAAVTIGLGGTFDYFAGIKPLSPDIAVKRNLGWLFRLITQPWRFKRIFRAFPQFPLKVFIESLK